MRHFLAIVVLFLVPSLFAGAESLVRYRIVQPEAENERLMLYGRDGARLSTGVFLHEKDLSLGEHTFLLAWGRDVEEGFREVSEDWLAVTMTEGVVLISARRTERGIEFLAVQDGTGAVLARKTAPITEARFTRERREEKTAQPGATDNPDDAQ